MLSAADETTLHLPPLYEAVAVARPELVVAEACRLAPERGAGTLVHALSPETLAFAVVLEPERPLVEARFAFFAGMAAAADAMAGHCAPEREIGFRWPDEIRYDAARIGGARLLWPEGIAETDTPDWLVFAVELIRDRPGLVDTGGLPDSTSLNEEEFGEPEALIESFARHLMRNFDAWANEGMTPITDAYLERLEPPSDRDWLIDGGGDLLERGEAGAAPVRHSLAGGLAACRWYDPARKAPLL